MSDPKAQLAAATKKFLEDHPGGQEQNPLAQAADAFLAEKEPAPDRSVRLANNQLAKKSQTFLTGAGGAVMPQLELPRRQQGTISFGPQGIDVRVNSRDPLSQDFSMDTPRPPAPKNRELQQTIRDLSAATLDIPDNPLPEQKLAELRLREDLKFQSENPAIHGQVPAEVRNVLTEFTALLNHAPVTPREFRDIVQNQRSDWVQAIAAGRAAFGLGPDEPRAQALAAMPDELFQQVAAKIRGNGIDAGQELLREDGPFGDEKAAFQTLSPGFFRFSEEKLPFYTGSYRFSRAVGQPIDKEFRGANLGENNLFDALPNESPFTVNALAPRFPALQEIQAQAAAQAEARERAGEAERQEIRQLPPLTQIGINITEKGGPLGVANEAAAQVMDWMDFASGRLLSAAIHKLDTVLNTGDVYQDLKSRLVRDKLQGLEAGAHAEHEYARILQEFPSISPDRVKELAASDIFTTRRLAAAMPEAFQKLTGKDLSVALGATDEGLKDSLDMLGGWFDNPGTAVLTLGVVPGIKRRIKDLTSTEAARRADRVLDPIEKADMFEVSADLRAQAFDRTMNRIRQRARDPQEARGFLQSVVDSLGEQGIGIDPAVAGKMRAAWEQLDLVTAKGGAKKLRRVLKRATTDIIDSANPQSFFKSAMVKDPANRVTINPDAPAAAVEAAAKYMNDAAVATSQLGTPEFVKRLPKGKDNRMYRKLATSAAAAISENARRAEAATKHVQAREVLRVVERDVTHTIESYRETAADLDTQIGLELREHNAGLRDAAARAVKFEHEGGGIPEANPVIGTKKFRQAQDLMKNPDAAEAFAFSGERLNKRGLRALGGDALLREAQEVFNEGASTMRVELRDLVTDAAQNLVKSTEAPVMRNLPPKSKPRTAALNTIVKKIEEATEKGEAVKLSDAELAILNDYRPANAKINPKFADRNKALLSARKRVQTRHDRDVAFRERVVNIAEEIENLAPGDLVDFRIPKRLHTEIAERMAGEETGLLYTKKRALSLSDASTVAPDLLAVWKELRETVPQEARFLKRKLIEKSGFELAALPPHLQQEYVTDFLHAERRRSNDILRRAAGILEELERKIPDDQRFLITKSIQEGKVDPRLPQDAANYIINEMRNLRLERLDWELNWEKISPSLYEKFANENYTHSTYTLNEDLAAEVQRSQLRNQSPSQALRLLEEDGRHFMFERPTDSFWVEWREGRKVKNRKGFKTREEAEKWADTNVPNARKTEGRYNVHAPETETAKILRGLELDPGVNFGQLMGNWVNDQAVYAWQRVTSQLDAVMRDGDIRAATGVTQKDFQSGLALITNDTVGTKVEMVRITSDRMPHLKGKWVPAKIMAQSAEIIGGRKIFDSLVEGWAELTQDAAAAEKAAGIVRTLNNVLSTTHVPLNPMSYMRGWMGNTTYAFFAGFNLFNPINTARFAGYMAETFKEFSEAAGRAGRTFDVNRLFTSKKLGTEVTELLEADLIHVGEALFNEQLSRTSRKFSNGVAGFENKIRDVQDRIAQLDKNSPLLEPAAKKLGELQDQLQEASQSGLKNWIKGLGTALGDFVTGKSRSVGLNRAWSTYTIGSGDTLMKIAAYKYLRRVKKMSKEVALQEIRDKFQTFHDPQKLKVMDKKFDVAQQIQKIPVVGSLLTRAQGFGGTMFLGFKTEQLRILANIVQRNPARLTQYLGMMAAWNAAAIARSGQSLDGYFEGYAQDQGVQRQGITDLQALLSGVVFGTGAGTFLQIPVEPILGIWFSEPYGGVGQKVADVIGQDTKNPWRRAAADVVGGAVGGLSFSNAPATLLGTVLTGQTTRGTPVGKGSTTKDFLQAFIGEPFLPPLLGSDRGRMLDAAHGEDVDPQTYKLRPFSQFVQERVFGIRTIRDPYRQVRTALNYWHSNRRDGAEAEWVRTENKEADVFHKVARGAINTSTGKIRSRAEHTEIVREHLAGKGKFATGPGGKQVPVRDDPNRLDDEVDRTANPKILSRFRHTSLEGMANVYIMFRNARKDVTQGDAAIVDRQLRRMITEKLAHGGQNNVQIDEVNTLFKAWRDSNLPDDAKRRLGVWSQILDQQLLERINR
jgi:hypothetical protein